MKSNRDKLDIEDRMIIQACLHDKYSLIQIAERLNINKSTVSREISRNSIIKKGTRLSCTALKKKIVCNLCDKKAYCTYTKHYYNFQNAQSMTDNRMRSTRCKPKIATSHIQYIDSVVSDGVRLGQSLHHIYVSNPLLSSICSERTIRRLVYRGNLSSRPHELRRYVRYRREYHKTMEELNIRDIRCLIGRSFKDYVRYVSSHKRLNVVQYDSVIGKREDKKAILTITFPKYNFQFGLLILKGNPTSVNFKLKAMFDRIGEDSVKEIFPINLCDNGIEFSIFYQNELNRHGQSVIRTFYTNPYKSTDKAECERNHELVRYCLPKGKSLDELTQDQIDEIFSNINSYVRASKKDKTPYDLARQRFGEAFLNTINIKRIPNKKVRLLPVI